MSVPQVLEVAIGLILVFYILGAIVSLITQWINEFFETRGKALERYLVKIVGDKKIGDFISLPHCKRCVLSATRICSVYLAQSPNLKRSKRYQLPHWWMRTLTLRG